ncbi:bifunctional demethylmenaquinone methyltransferase/2-methoxy-6-polyprenyl-1,4-benzoquinol methylase UbiE [Blattabacterium cuenoti]|uniref:bifunctional demethylmenaquinone methyltransferase/2-methoxy-6-polyprenyl-1,4-benzoquinol methylase UbiE n=1 Tax=Blattabacterium cuenoti TaxID=1653831 RepID=UPI00163CB178|nr:bifunctional demethylmenaquinone methyltransferase/2-methoxy-6-polyprenyl-1,4-benzoquinol methylase UbiE [Blattabacterium cuenoti]
MNKYSFSLKEKKIKNMFNHIACKYDLINHIISFGIDFFWRKKIVYLLDKFNKKKTKNILDLATGTGDLAILLAKKFNKAKITGLDPSEKMLKKSEEKIKNNSLGKKIKLIQGYSQNIPFKNETFDMVTISFGIRNFQNIDLSIREIYRVLKPFGLLGILEFSRPSNSFIRKIYEIYSHILMKIGGMLSKNYFAYNYLVKSIQLFPYYGNIMNNLIKNYKFDMICTKKLTFKIVSIYLFTKR